MVQIKKKTINNENRLADKFYYLKLRYDIKEPKVKSENMQRHIYSRAIANGWFHYHTLRKSYLEMKSARQKGDPSIDRETLNKLSKGMLETKKALRGLKEQKWKFTFP
jgi:hypothetical protein